MICVRCRRNGEPEDDTMVVHLSSGLSVVAHPGHPETVPR